MGGLYGHLHKPRVERLTLGQHHPPGLGNLGGQEAKLHKRCPELLAPYAPGLPSRPG